MTRVVMPGYGSKLARRVKLRPKYWRAVSLVNRGFRKGKPVTQTDIPRGRKKHMSLATLFNRRKEKRGHAEEPGAKKSFDVDKGIFLG